MLQGKIYDASDEELLTLRRRAHALCADYNKIKENNGGKRSKIIRKLLPQMGKNGYLQGPVYFDYGVFIKIGINFYANFNLTVLDVCPVTIGDNVFVGPNVSILTPKHPLLPDDRRAYINDRGVTTVKEYGAPVEIGDDCWIAGNVTVLAGAKIGKGCVIGAGSVVAGNIPDGTLAYGNPCRVVRKITPDDAIELKKQLF